jgi:hypothetical protein
MTAKLFKRFLGRCTISWVPSLGGSSLDFGRWRALLAALFCAPRREGQKGSEAIVDPDRDA